MSAAWEQDVEKARETNSDRTGTAIAVGLWLFAGFHGKPAALCLRSCDVTAELHSGQRDIKSSLAETRDHVGGRNCWSSENVYGGQQTLYRRRRV